MAIQSINNNQMIVQPTTYETEQNNELGQEEFLNILMTQLEYQDPLAPMEDTEFIAQLAEFSALEQMQNMSGTMSNIETFSMLGKTITFETIDEATGTQNYEQGEVESVIRRDNNFYLVVNGEEIDMDSVIVVTETAE